MGEPIYDCIDQNLHTAECLIRDLKAEIKRLKGLIEFDRTGLAQALAKIRHEADGRSWIGEHRGPWRYDQDEEYRAEFAALTDYIVKTADDALHKSGSLVTEAFHPARTDTADRSEA